MRKFISYTLRVIFNVLNLAISLVTPVYALKDPLCIGKASQLGLVLEQLQSGGMLLVRLFLDRLAGLFHVLTETSHGIAAGQSGNQQREHQNNESLHSNLHPLKLRKFTKYPAIAAAAAIILGI